MDKDSLKPLIETIVFAADHPISFERLMNVLEGEQREEVRAALNEIINEYASSGRGLFQIGFQKLTRASMETLAIVAYKQPVTRVEVEEIRGVDSGGVLKTLMDRQFVKILGRKEVPGRPAVYGTTKEFLEVFDLKDLSCLPTLKEVMMPKEEDIGGETAEDNSAGGDSVQTQGGTDDSGGEGHGQPQGSDEVGGQG